MKLNDITYMYILLSNDFSSFCHLKYEKTIPQNNITNYTTIYNNTINAINQLINFNKNKNFVPIIELIGGDNLNIWENLTKPIINYIRTKEEIITIVFQIENSNFLNDELLQFLNTNDIFLKIIFNNNTKNIIEDCLKIHSLLQIKYIIDEYNYKDFYQDYLLLQKLNVQNLEFIHYFTDNTIDMSLIENNYIKICNFIYTQFENNTIPLIPINFKKIFPKIILQYIENNKKIKILNIQKNLELQCPMLSQNKIIFDYTNNYYMCLCNFSHISQFLNVTKEINNNQEIQIYDTLFQQKNIDSLQLKTLFYDNNKNCLNCKYDSICSKNCSIKNLMTASNTFMCNNLYCKIFDIEYQSALQLINSLSKIKNTLFKTYFQSIINNIYKNDR